MYSQAWKNEKDQFNLKKNRSFETFCWLCTEQFAASQKGIERMLRLYDTFNIVIIIQ